MKKIKLSAAERQSGFDRVYYAELLILQLPEHHDGRNTWLLNYGAGPEAERRRRDRKLKWDTETRSAETTSCK